MSQQPTISSVMTKQPAAVESRLGVKEAQKMMIEHQFRHLPVVDAGRVVGVVSDRDILLAQIAHHGLDGELSVGDVCSLQTYIVAPDAPLSDVLENMARRHIGSALVAENGELVGIYTATDACKNLAKMLSGTAL